MSSDSNALAVDRFSTLLSLVSLGSGSPQYDADVGVQEGTAGIKLLWRFLNVVGISFHFEIYIS